MKHILFPLTLAVAAIAAPALAAEKVPDLLTITPTFSGQTEMPVDEVSFTFASTVQLQSLRVTGPYGDASQEQELVGDNDKVPLAASYHYTLKTPVSAIGRYSIDMMAWHAASKTSISRSTSFGIGTQEQLNAYDEAREKKAEADAAAAEAAEKAGATKGDE